MKLTTAALLYYTNCIEVSQTTANDSGTMSDQFYLGTDHQKTQGGGWGEVQKNIRARENYMKKNSCTPINPKKYSCYGQKKIHTRNLITKKNS